MYLKSLRTATFILTALCAIACSTRLPWSDEPTGQETNVAFTVENNLLYVRSIKIDGHRGRFLIGSSQPSSVIDSAFLKSLGSSGSTHALHLSETESIHFSGVVTNLQGVGDAIVGADVWRPHAVTLDYYSGLLTLQREGIHPELMTIYRFSAQPTITISVDGQSMPAVVDTTSPDTVVLPGQPGRRTASITIAGIDFGRIDVGSGNVETARVGNRVLSKFLVTIDYGKRVVGLWRDPRTPL